MSFNPLFCREMIRLFKNETIKSVVELGNQTFQRDNISILKKYINETNATTDFSNIIKSADVADQTEQFFCSLGATRYVAVDVNTKYNSLPMDLNHSLANKYGFDEKFDLVTNNGTGEHIFDQCSVFKNIHNLVKKDGLMVHMLPFAHWPNHGFYNFNPILFFDLAYANDYQITRFLIGEGKGEFIEADISDGTRRSKKQSSRRFNPLMRFGALYIRCLSYLLNHGDLADEDLVTIVKYPRRGHKLLAAIEKMQRGRKDKDISIFVVMRKVNEKEFRIPIQGKYFSDIESETISENYDRE